MEAILKLPDLLDDKDRKKAMKTSSGVSGIEYISVNMEDRVLTATGDFDPIQLLEKLKKLCSVTIVRINSQGKDQKGGGTAGDTVAAVKLDLHDENDKQKAMKIVSCIPGVYLIWVTMKDGKLTAKGDFNPIHVVDKLKKHFPLKLELVSTAKEEKKGKDQGKAKDGNEKGGNKNSGGGGGGGMDQKGGGGQVVPYPYPFHIPHVPHQYPPYMYQNYPPMPAAPLKYYYPEI
ncbi:hypothetical protein MLD38_030397 [Melastoma candidum]|uniref:Uncharacterized protein n=1 Tax=Melastoma candidum TaxID=119954 RepID=A0ACB9ML22_9MYRT|nr:hypothetical protein MLD38_030397 [Melastoma candidum]